MSWINIMEVYYTPNFKEGFSGLEREIKERAKDKLKLFKKDPSHPSLRTHKLKGKLAGLYSFWVTEKYRIVFLRKGDKAYLLHIGDHDIYR